MADRLKITAVDLVGVQVSRDGWFVRADLVDQDGRTVCVTLPTECLNALANAVPQAPEPDTLHVLDNWSMDRSGNGEDLVLTLRTADARAVTFLTKAWQVKGMATVATWANSHTDLPKSVH